MPSTRIRAARRADQAGHEIHERGFAGSVGPNQAGDAGWDGQTHAIHAENFPVEFGDILEHHLIVRAHYRITSEVRISEPP